MRSCLLWAAMLIGAIPRSGKTFVARLVALAAALDPHVQIRVHDLKAARIGCRSATSPTDGANGGRPEPPGKGGVTVAGAVGPMTTLSGVHYCAPVTEHNRGRQVGTMSYGHGPNIVAGHGEESDDGRLFNNPDNGQPGQPAAQPLPVPSDWYTRPELEPALWSHNVGALYEWLAGAGMSQRQIAILAEQSQSEVSDLRAGRRGAVRVYEVLVRLCRKFGIPPERMGLSWWGADGRYYGPPDAYPGEVTVAHTPRGVPSAMLRRHLIALGGMLVAVTAGVPVAEAAYLKVGELLDELGHLPPILLPSRLTVDHVTEVQDMTRRLGVGHTHYMPAELTAAAAAQATRLLKVPGPDTVHRALKVAVAELRLQAGWSALDAGLYQHALYHYAHALELATDADDPYCQAAALRYAGLANAEHGHPDDGLKLLQAAQVKAWDIPTSDDRRAVTAVGGRAAAEACALEESALALARMDDIPTALVHLAQGREKWTPTRTDPYGDMDRPGARLELARGRLDAAYGYATASLHRWEGGRHLSRIQTGLVLATITVTAGEWKNLQAVHDTITTVGRLRSVRIRWQLAPLIKALDARPSADTVELARMARQVAA